MQVLPPKTSGELRALALPVPSPALTWVAKVKFIVRVTVVVPVPEGSVGFMVVADKDRKEDGGGALEEEAQQGQLQSPARGAAGRPGHGIEAASLRLRLGLLERGPGRHSTGGPGRFHSSQAPPTRARPRPQGGLPARSSWLQPGRRGRVGGVPGLRWGKEWKAMGRLYPQVLFPLGQLTLAPFRLGQVLGNDPREAPHVLPAGAQLRDRRGRWGGGRREGTRPLKHAVRECFPKNKRPYRLRLPWPSPSRVNTRERRGITQSFVQLKRR